MKIIFEEKELIHISRVVYNHEHIYICKKREGNWYKLLPIGDTCKYMWISLCDSLVWDSIGDYFIECLEEISNEEVHVFHDMHQMITFLSKVV